MGQIWTNWSGSVSSRPRGYFYPESQSELVDIVETNRSSGDPIRVVGSGHSFTPLVETPGIIVSLENYTGITDVDEENETVTVNAGTQIKELTRGLARRGLAMENMGDIDKQSIAGAISTGTHGTGIRYGIISDQVVEITLVTAEGEVITCSEDQLQETFKSAQVSLGALGIISKVKLRVEDAAPFRLEKTVEPLDRCLSNIDEYRENNRHFEFFWFPHTEKAIVKKINKVDERELYESKRRGGSDYSQIVYNRSREVCCEIARHLPPTSRLMSNITANLIQEKTVVEPSHQIYANIRGVKFNEMEYGVPADRGPDVLYSIKERIEDQGLDVQFPVEFRFVRGDDISLSPAYGRDTAFIAVHRYHKKPYRDFFSNFEPTFRRNDGRPHWGKHHSLTASELEPRYPQWESFQAARTRLDPEGVFLNGYLEEIFESDT